MKHLFSLIVTILLALSTAAFAANDSKIVLQPQGHSLVMKSEISIPSEVEKAAKEFTDPMSKQAPSSVPLESTKALGIDQDDTLIVRVVESPEIDTKLTVYAVIISAVAVSFSAISLVVSATLQIKHNRDEVRPIVAIHLDLVSMSIRIKNHGVGPALFQKMVWRNVKSHASANTLAGLLNEEWRKLNLESSFYIYTKPFTGASNDPNVLAPQEELFFIVGDRPNYPMTEEEKIKLGKTFKDIEVQLTYTDLYGRKKWTLIKNLSWMADWS